MTAPRIAAFLSVAAFATLLLFVLLRSAADQQRAERLREAARLRRLGKVPPRDEWNDEFSAPEGAQRQ